ncbi:PIN domain nuclease [Candidatus Roizmanbacteria bacterium CG10_big_fil_rev_8_21_14_0_10_39_12]|uniref:PIN domain nuclease n=1 Tax=Candidatus Roizmanbacteria bacterium CG10_big_fil_rev_8_21_14_0_10_39_12 TaxID=1974852 RepID=A0A2M8KPU4_9BACT|nr:MAG: PIN domain nuclease [Candidatus Roizmanbacteria bacterium CG10_big_fil_rev_8_21_14_0_10_39_12]
MNILLDTSTFIWTISNPDRLSKKAKEVYLDEDNACFLSVVSTWEMIVKFNFGKLPLPEQPEKIITSQVAQHSIQIISLEMNDILQLSKLHNIKSHKDPFDRMLACQSLARKMPILTPDPWIKAYEVKTIW